MKAAAEDIRFTIPLYTVAEAARFLGVSPSTLSTWARGYVRRPPARRIVRAAPVIASVEAHRNFPSIPFVGLAEGMVIAAFRRAGVSLQHIRKAVDVLEREIALDHALASRRLYLNGPVILYDYADREDEELAGLTEVVSQQRVFSPVVKAYLERIEYDPNGWAAKIASPVTPRPVVVVDPRRAFGQPIFVHGAAPVESVMSRLKAGEPRIDVARDFGVPIEDLETYLGAVHPVAA